MKTGGQLPPIGGQRKAAAITGGEVTEGRTRKSVDDYMQLLSGIHKFMENPNTKITSVGTAGVRRVEIDLSKLSQSEREGAKQLAARFGFKVTDDNKLISYAVVKRSKVRVAPQWNMLPGGQGQASASRSVMRYVDNEHRGNFYDILSKAAGPAKNQILSGRWFAVKTAFKSTAEFEKALPMLNAAGCKFLSPKDFANTIRKLNAYLNSFSKEERLLSPGMVSLPSAIDYLKNSGGIIYIP